MFRRLLVSQLFQFQGILTMLRPPPTRDSTSSLGSSNLPYLADDASPSASTYGGVMSPANPSSWGGYEGYELEAPQVPPPKPPPEPSYQNQWNSNANVAGPSDLRRRVTRIANDFAAMRHFDPRTVIDTYRQDDEYDDDDYLEDPSLFINLALLSHIAVQLQAKVPRGTHVKGSVPYPRAFTGKDIVVRISFASSAMQALTDLSDNHTFHP